MCATSIGEYACRWMSGAVSFASRSQRLVVLQRPVGVDAGLDAELGRAVRQRVVDPRDELVALVRVGVRRAPPLAEAAERAADDAHVRHVDVAVDDERDRVPRQLGAQLVGRLAHVLDRLGPRLGEQRGDLAGVERAAGARPRDRVRPQRALRPVDAAGAAARDEAPVLRLDHVEDVLRQPLGVDEARVDAEPLGQRHAVRAQPLAHLVRRRERVLGRDVVAVRSRARRGRSRPRRRAAATSRRGSAGSGSRPRASAAAPRARAAPCRRP